MQILDRAGVAEGEFIGANSHDGAVFFVQGGEPDVAEAWGGVVKIEPFCEGGQARPGKLSERVEEEAVKGDA